MFERFVDSFGVDCRPEILSMSGGEALLRPTLVKSLADRARQAGTRTSVLSGLFFARRGHIPPAILAAIDSVDHFSVSLDVFHEQEVPRANVFRVLDEVLSRGTDVSIHLVATGAEDPYLEGLITDVRQFFGDRVPMLVNSLSHFGRARSWLRVAEHRGPQEIEANPCAMAAWPVVAFDGRIVACGNDDAMEHPPAHLILGHAARDDWDVVRARTLESAMMRAIRLFGPQYISQRYAGLRSRCAGYCRTCMALSDDAVLTAQVDEVMARTSTALLEREAEVLQRQAGALSFLRRHSVPQYAELATLGAPT